MVSILLTASLPEPRSERLDQRGPCVLCAWPGWLAVIAVLLMTLSGVRAEQKIAEPVTAETPLLHGPDLTLTVADYRQALLALPSEHRLEVDKDPVKRRELLFELYTEQLLVREAQRRGLDQEPEVQAQLAQAPRKILVNALVREEQAAQPSPDFTALAEEYYLTHRQSYEQPKRIQVAHILWRTPCACEESEKRAQADATLKELRAGADFAELARKYSEDKATSAQGGNLEQWITPGFLAPSFNDAAFALAEPGALSDVVKTEYGYHIIKLLASEPAGVEPFEQVKDRVIDELSKKYRTAAHKAFIAQFYPKTDQYNNAAIDALPVADTVPIPSDNISH